MSRFTVPAMVLAGLAIPAGAQAATTMTHRVGAGSHQVAQATSGTTESSENLSSKLHESGGVIKPKANVDPGMRVPAPVPHPNSTPVIPPSATGGNTAK